MSYIPLTSAQATALRFLADQPGGRATALGFSVKCPRPITARVLFRDSLVEGDGVPAAYVTITEAGRRALASYGRGKGANSGKGRDANWVIDHKDHQGDECLIWPYGRCNGYPHIINYKSRKIYAHRFMCELVNGPPPTPKHHAAHSCGNGHNACINPRHLSWKTVSENQFDRTRHGRKSTGARGVLTRQQANEIRALKGRKTQRELAEMFGVSRSTISWVHCGRTWRQDSMKWRPEELEMLRQATGLKQPLSKPKTLARMKP